MKAISSRVVTCNHNCSSIMWSGHDYSDKVWLSLLSTEKKIIIIMSPAVASMFHKGNSTRHEKLAWYYTKPRRHALVAWWYRPRTSAFGPLFLPTQKCLIWFCERHFTPNLNLQIALRPQLMQVRDNKHARPATNVASAAMSVSFCQESFILLS